MELTKTKFNITDECGNCWPFFINNLKFSFPEFAMYVPATQEFYFSSELTDEKYQEIQEWVNNFNCEDAEKLFYENVNDTTVNTVIKSRIPSLNENLPVNTIWINNKTGEIFVNIDNTPDANIWVGIKTGRVIRPLPPVQKFDVFEDGSCQIFYPFDGNLKDLGGKYHGQERKNTVFFKESILGKSAYLTNRAYIEIPYLPLPEEFSVSLWFSTKKPSKDSCLFHVTQTGNNYLSFWVTKSSLKVIYADKALVVKQMSAADWKKTYHFVIQTDGKVFLNGKKFLDTGILMNGNSVRMNPLIGADRDGRSINDWFTGFVDEFRFFNRNLTEDEVDLLYQGGAAIMEEDA